MSKHSSLSEPGSRSLSGGEESCCEGMRHQQGGPRDVKGWLLYKSALELWDDVERHHDEPSALHASYATLNRLPLPPLPPSGAESSCTVKRTKSLWRFGLGRKHSMPVIDGMSMWRHRSLVDIPKETKPRRSASRVQDTPRRAPQEVPRNITRPQDPPPPIPPPRDENMMTLRDHVARRAPAVGTTNKLPKIDENKSRHFQSLQRFHKKSEKSSSSNNLYGPWYDLWGKDSSVIDSHV